MPTVLELAYRLYSCIRERIKALTQTSFSYFINPRSCYSKKSKEKFMLVTRKLDIRKSIFEQMTLICFVTGVVKIVKKYDK